jgi:hypothetical protein
VCSRNRARIHTHWAKAIRAWLGQCALITAGRLGVRRLLLAAGFTGRPFPATRALWMRRRRGMRVMREAASVFLAPGPARRGTLFSCGGGGRPGWATIRKAGAFRFIPKLIILTAMTSSDKGKRYNEQHQ